MKFIKIKNLFNTNNDNKVSSIKLSSDIADWLRYCLFDVEVKEEGIPVQIKITTYPEVTVEYTYSIEEINSIPRSLKSFIGIKEKIKEQNILKALKNKNCTCYLYCVLNCFGELLLHDVKIDNHWKNAREIRDLAELMNIKVVRCIGKMSIIDSVRYLYDRNYLDTIIIKAPVDIKDYKGDRIMYKIESSTLKNFKENYNIPVYTYLNDTWGD